MLHRPFKKILFFLLIIIPVHLSIAHNQLSASGRIAVVGGSYDSIGKVLKNYHIPYESIKLQDLHDINKIDKYTSIFLPSGMEVPLHKKINLVASGTRIKSVMLNKDALKTDEKKISRNIKTFIENGGSVYFSGYSYKYLQLAYNLFTFFNNFPYMGMPGRIITENRSDLYRFSLSKRSPLYITFPGWIAVKSADDADILSMARFQTPRGEKNGLISFVLRRGMGEALFTSYYSTVFSSFRRFNIYRIAGSHLLKKQFKESSKYQQSVTGRIVDSLLGREISRTYRFDLIAGNNTLYFTGESGDYQLDLFDKDMSLILSVESINDDHSFDIQSPDNSVCYARIYPVSKKRYGIFSLISASGERYFPYYKTTAVITSLILFLAVVFTFIYLFGGKKYPGRPKMIS
jgi:hypothetical protein